MLSVDIPTGIATPVLKWLFAYWSLACHVIVITGQLSEDPYHPKIQFPPYEICPNCYDSDKKTFKENEILNFLVHFYTDIKTDQTKFSKSKTISAEETDQEDQGDDDRRNVNPKFKRGRGDSDKINSIDRSEILKNHFDFSEDEKYNNTSMVGLNKFDFSLCLALWVFSAGALVLLFIFFKFRRTRHKFVKNFYSDYKV